MLRFVAVPFSHLPDHADVAVCLYSLVFLHLSGHSLLFICLPGSDRDLQDPNLDKRAANENMRRVQDRSYLYIWIRQRSAVDPNLDKREAKENMRRDTGAGRICTS
jgi:hypothetical protein